MIQCQRWQVKRESWRPAGELFAPQHHDVAEIDEPDAKAFVVKHHYSGTFPAARFRVGLFRKGTSALQGLVGVAIFSVPMQQRVIPKYTGLAPLAGVELGRFVLLDEIEANGETWFLGRAFEMLAQRRPEIQAVVSYADPLPRLTLEGRQVTPGHVGTIYQAHNGRYMGRGKAENLLLDRDGRVITRRALSKLKHGEQGRDYVYARLRAAGAPERRLSESGEDYVTRVVGCGVFRRLRHPGNHCYAWPLGGRRVKRELLSRFAPACDYPKKGV